MEINQKSFKGGMNLLVDDTRPTADIEGDTSRSAYGININQYRIGFNVRCRYDVLDPILSSYIDSSAPVGIKQGITTFGNYLILFCAGKAYFRPFNTIGWTQIPTFAMSPIAQRYWFIAVPLGETNYARVATPAANSTGVAAGNTTGSASSSVNRVNIASAFFGNIPGLLVQDGVNQPQFIYLDANNFVQCKVTQTYAQWTFTWTSDPSSATYGTVTVDERSYVPIGTYMEIYNGILFIVDSEGENIYRSVSGRPLDFVVNVDINGQKGGDATTTSYSVGVGGISCLKNLPAGLFISAGNACFSITLNTNINAPLLFGEYTFIRTPLFTASCITDKAIIDINGDTGFVDVRGLRTFNSILQLNNEGRNSVFSKTVSSLLDDIVQNPNAVAAVNFDNYALFAVNTIYGNVIVVYDTINQVFSSVDINQFSSTTGISQFALVSTDQLALFAITTDNKVIQLYAGPNYDPCTVRFMSVCSQNPKTQVKQSEFRAILSEFVQNSTATLTVFVDNRLSGNSEKKTISYVAPNPAYSASPSFTDANTQVQPLFWSTPNAAEGWKSFNVLTWTGGGRITNILTVTTDNTPLNPLGAQANVT